MNEDLMIIKDKAICTCENGRTLQSRILSFRTDFLNSDANDARNMEVKGVYNWTLEAKIEAIV